MVVFIESCVYPFVFFERSKQYFDIFSMAVQGFIVLDFDDPVFASGDNGFVVL